jgi:hypothetical protein
LACPLQRVVQRARGVVHVTRRGTDRFEPLERPVLSLHHSFNGDAIDSEVVTDVRYSCGVGLEGFLGDDAGISNVGRGNDKGIGGGTACQSLPGSNELLKMLDGEDLSDELRFLLAGGKEYALVAINPIAEMLATGNVIQLLSDLTNGDYAAVSDKSVELVPKGRKPRWEVVTTNTEAAAI